MMYTAWGASLVQRRGASLVQQCKAPLLPWCNNGRRFPSATVY